MTVEDPKALPEALKNSPLLNRMVRHFKDAGARRHEVDMGDGGAPLVFYSEPMTLKDKSKLMDNMEVDQAVAFIETIIDKALDADGQKLFRPDAKRWLLTSADPDTVSAMFHKINRGVPPIEELEGNSEATPPDTSS